MHIADKLPQLFIKTAGIFPQFFFTDKNIEFSLQTKNLVLYLHR
jgi:hypothetical protein